MVHLLKINNKLDVFNNYFTIMCYLWLVLQHIYFFTKSAGISNDCLFTIY
jgi:hypothetical protein